jgi:hypothetical protein
MENEEILMMMKTNYKSGEVWFLILVLLTIPLFLSCVDNDDDETKITVCNQDDREYDVELRRHSDNTVEGEIHLEEWYDLGHQCDTFDDVDEGRYYLVVFDDDDNDIVDESDDFYMDEGDHKTFKIDGSGDIFERSKYDDGAIMSVCNSDDNGYRVTLKRSLDDSVVADFDLKQWSDLSDQCNDFKDLHDGSYYIQIDEEGDSKRAARSEDFYLESDEIKYLTINQHGDLVSGH